MGFARAQPIRRATLTLRTDRIRQLPPWLHRPMARCGAGRRGQHEDNWEILLRRLSAQRNRFGRSFIEKARGLLAGEGDCLRSISQHLFTESRNIDREVEGLMVHSRTGFAHIGEANAELQQAWKLCGSYRRGVMPTSWIVRQNRLP